MNFDLFSIFILCFLCSKICLSLKLPFYDAWISWGESDKVGWDSQAIHKCTAFDSRPRLNAHA